MIVVDSTLIAGIYGFAGAIIGAIIDRHRDNLTLFSDLEGSSKYVNMRNKLAI
jgi:hypothetical protein